MKLISGYVILGYCFLFQTVSGSLQKVVFYEKANCTGEFEETYSSMDEAALNNSLAINAKSVQVVGLWTFTHQYGKLNSTPILHLGHPPEGSCYGKDLSNDILYYSNIEVHGALEMDKPSVYFFTGKEFQGAEFSTNKDDPKIRQNPAMVQSYIQFGNSSWISYPDHDFKGTRTCLCQTMIDGVAPVDGFSFNNSNAILLGSVLLDYTNYCRCGQEWTGGRGSALNSKCATGIVFYITLLMSLSL